MRLFRRSRQQTLEQLDPQLTALRQEHELTNGQDNNVDNVSVADSCNVSVVSRAGSVPASSSTPKILKKSGM